MKDNTITISKGEFLQKYAEATAKFAAEHPDMGVAFVLTSALACRVVTNALFGEED